LIATVLSWLAWAGPVQAEDRLTPSWMAVDADTRKIEMDIVAGYNVNNNNWNFNGYYNGGLTVTVPLGWSVRIAFSSLDGNYPHSLVIIDDPGAPDNLPMQAGREDVGIRRAYSKNPLGGIFANDRDTLSFKVKEAGDYLIFCGVPGHGVAGMWVFFKVSADADTPYISVAESADEGRR
jgi:sulfocyanin